MPVLPDVFARSRWPATLLVLYGFLYLVLQLEDYALLAGAILGFILLAGVMFSTLTVNWSGRRDGDEPVPPQPVEDRA